MSWKSHFTATFATVLVAAGAGCDSDPTSPGSEPISIAGVYDYTFDVSNGEEGEDEVACQGQGVITVVQQSDFAFTAQTAADGFVECTGFGIEIPEQSGVVNLAGEIDDREVTFQFPLLEDSELCDASGEILGDPVTGMSGTATCMLDPEVFGREGAPIELIGPWNADRTGG